MFVSRAIRSLTEEWLVEAGLSPASRGHDARQSPDQRGVSRSYALRPSSNTFASACTAREDPIGQRKKDQRKSPRKADKAAAKGKSPADISEEPPALRRRLKSMRELCSANARVNGQDYHTIQMCNLPERAFDAPLEPDLRPLTYGMPVWQSGEASATYIRGMLIPRLATDLYTLPSEVLMDGATKAMVLFASEAQSLAEHLRVELDEEQLDDSKGQLRGVRAQVRQMETELLDLARSKDALREELLRRAIEDYKKSPGFKMGLMRMGRVSLEYRYQLVLARLQARHPEVKIELDPFVSLPEDDDVPMADEQPFDDSLPPPKE
ncbi:hypothetical protein B296_00038443 [Ensete ventricosum]|uniref:Uncharacterized protein n=1 Tax=Ensete ventricosum TaxID=4639 RepID=A0A426Z326_ENSVE|nr:hypothetical protein B296_00038443 [Ensete ventricosum]